MDQPQYSEWALTARRLRLTLRQLRREAGMTQTDVGEALFWSVSKVIRIEAGTVRPALPDVRALLDLYVVTDATARDRVLLLAELLRRTPYGRFMGLLSEETSLFISGEAAALGISSFHPFFIPDVLQTSAYARKMISYADRQKNQEQLGPLLQLRTDRRGEIFSGSVERRLKFVVDEVVLHRMPAGPDIMVPQLEQLIEDSERDNVVILVVPFRSGVYRGMRTPFTLLDFPAGNEPDLLYLEHDAGGRIFRAYDDDPIRPESDDAQSVLLVSTYHQIFAELERMTSPTESAELLYDALRRLKNVDDSDVRVYASVAVLEGEGGQKGDGSSDLVLPAEAGSSSLSAGPSEVQAVVSIVYIDTNSDEIGLRALAAAQDLARFLGLEPSGRIEERKGSRWYRFSSFLRRSLKSESGQYVRDRAEEVVKAFQLEQLEKRQGEVDLQAAQIVSTLVATMDSACNAFYIVGPIVAIKRTINGESTQIVRQLSDRERKMLREYPELQTQPDKLWELLGTLVAEGGNGDDPTP